jgi:hypothetical protein
MGIEKDSKSQAEKTKRITWNLCWPPVKIFRVLPGSARGITWQKPIRWIWYRMRAIPRLPAFTSTVSQKRLTSPQDTEELLDAIATQDSSHGSSAVGGSSEAWQGMRCARLCQSDSLPPQSHLACDARDELLIAQLRLTMLIIERVLDGHSPAPLQNLSEPFGPNEGRAEGLGLGSR